MGERTLVRWQKYRLVITELPRTTSPLYNFHPHCLQVIVACRKIKRRAENGEQRWDQPRWGTARGFDLPQVRQTMLPTLRVNALCDSSTLRLLCSRQLVPRCLWPRKAGAHLATRRALSRSLYGSLSNGMSCGGLPV